MKNRIRLNAFNMTAAGHQSAGMWKHPESQAHRYKDLDHWVDMAKTLERGCFDALFLADVLGPYDVLGGSADAALRNGVQIPGNDPFQYISAMAAVTEKLGFAVTASATLEQPYPLARRLSTLDHLTKGRVGWNVVTSYLDSATRAFGAPDLKHDERYELAEEFMEVVYKLWEGSWDSDAVRLDRANGIFTDPSKVRSIHHDGRFFNVDAFNMSEPSPQRTPAIFQAGASSRGQEFAARHGEGLFVNVLNSALSKQLTGGIRDQVEAQGRGRDAVKIHTILTAVVADSDAEAERRYREYQEYSSDEGGLALFGGFSGLDMSKFDPNEPLEAMDTNAIQNVLNLFTKLDPERRWTPAEIGKYMSIGGIEPVLVGSPETIADEIERWVDDGDLDGINLSYAVTPYDTEAFVDMVVPELQKRGRVWKEYEGNTLREYLAGTGNQHLDESHPGSKYSRVK